VMERSPFDWLDRIPTSADSDAGKSRRDVDTPGCDGRAEQVL
jgi:hypothetical protein